MIELVYPFTIVPYFLFYFMYPNLAIPMKALPATVLCMFEINNIEFMVASIADYVIEYDLKPGIVCFAIFHLINNREGKYTNLAFVLISLITMIVYIFDTFYSLLSGYAILLIYSLYYAITTRSKIFIIGYSLFIISDSLIAVNMLVNSEIIHIIDLMLYWLALSLMYSVKKNQTLPI